MARVITIVDDSEELRTLITLFLHRHLGVLCLGKGSLDEVIADAENVLRSDLVILDINLGPGRPDGCEVYRWLRARNFAGQVFFLTGHAKSHPTVQQAQASGVRILEKPVAPEELILLVEGSSGAGQGSGRYESA